MQEYLSVVKTVLPILQRGRSLDSTWDPEASPLAKQIVYGVLRNYFRLNEIVNTLVTRPLPDKHCDLRILIMAGLYSVDDIRRPDYTSVNDTVESAAGLGKSWAKGMVNGVLRNYLRNRETIDGRIRSKPEVATNHPAWLSEWIRKAWPASFDDIIAANNAQAPMTLRVNLAKTTTTEFRERLASKGIGSAPGRLAASAVYLDTPLATADLPGFDEGLVSVQDEASQLAATLVQPKAGDKVLDACAAPGGKTCHLLETEPGIELVALDVDAERCRQIRENLKRTGTSCEVVVADLLEWDSASTFDRILLDAPCSATGIIRRHPDIKLLRRESDIAKLVGAQLRLFHAAWQLLKTGGVLVYSTCSILPEENEQVVDRFCGDTGDAQPLPIDADWGQGTGSGRQLFPVVDGHDGFFYARLTKSN